jgi:hypothetical protein
MTTTTSEYSTMASKYLAADSTGYSTMTSEYLTTASRYSVK